MSATIVGERRQTTLPADVCEAAGIQPSDQLDWWFEDGQIRARKLVQETAELLDTEDVDPKTLLPKDGSQFIESSITAAVRSDPIPSRRIVDHGPK